MTFILVPNEGEDLHVNAWNWRPTLELLYAAGVITEDDHECLGGHGLGGKVNAERALLIAEVLTRKLRSMNSGERMLADLSVSKEPKELVVFSPDMKPADVDSHELYSTSYEWLDTFAEFCRSSKGFDVK